MNEATAIELSNVGVFRHDRWILGGIDWKVPAGACAAVLGPNGSGKSTLARILAGHLWPSAGDVRVLGAHFGETDLPSLRKRIRLLQPAGPYDVDLELTAIDVVLTGFFGTLGLYDQPTGSMRDEAERVLAQVGLSHVASHRYSTLSSGERIRSLMARALVQKPALLLLDEPTAGLDLLAREQVLATVESMFTNTASPPTVLIITHHIEELPPATSHVLVLADGRCAAQGAPADVFQEEILSRVYNCPVQVRRSGGRHYLEVHPSAWEGLLKNGRPT